MVREDDPTKNVGVKEKYRDRESEKDPGRERDLYSENAVNLN